MKVRIAPFESARLPGQRCADGLRALGVDYVVAHVKGGQRGAEKPNGKRKTLNSRLVGIGSRSGVHHSKARAYLGNAAAMAFAPSAPISFPLTSSVVNGTLKKQSCNKQQHASREF